MGAGRLNDRAPIHRHKVNSAEWTRVEFRMWLSVRGGLGNFRATYILNGINIAIPLPMAYLKIVFCKISNFTAFARNLIFSS